MIALPMPTASISAASVFAWPNGVSFSLDPRSDQPCPGRSKNSSSARPSSSGLSGTIWSLRLALAPWMKTIGGRSALAGPGTCTKWMRVPLATANAPTGGLRRSTSQAPTRVTPASTSIRASRKVIAA